MAQPPPAYYEPSAPYAPQQHYPPQQQYPPQQHYPPPQYPPQQHYPPPAQPTAATVTVVHAQGGGGTKCPSCQNTVTPVISQSTGSDAWVWVFVLFILGFFFPILWFGFCLIPLCVVKESRRKCPVCRYDLGRA